jgi:uncharacterized C2H2 Zn-finger protein
MKCRRHDAVRVEVKRNGVFPCNICDAEFKSRADFNAHVFSHHTEAELQGRYRKDLTRIMRKQDLQMLQNRVFKAIAKGKFQVHILQLLGRERQAYLLGSKYLYNMHMELDDELRELRQVYYEKTLEMLMKLTDRKEPATDLPKDLTSYIKYSDGLNEHSFDLRRNYNQEHLPIQVLSVLRATLQYRLKKHSFFPHLKGLSGNR